MILNETYLVVIICAYLWSGYKIPVPLMHYKISNVDKGTLGQVFL